MQECLDVARHKGNEDAEQQILGIIKGEQERAFWRRLKYTMAAWTGGSVQSVQVEDTEGNVEVFCTQQEVHGAIWRSIYQKQFFLAEEAPICKGTLQEVFRYNAATRAGDKALDSSLWFDPDFDKLTKAICQELVMIQEAIPKDSISNII